MHPLDLAASAGFVLAAAGGALLYEQTPSVPGALLPLVAIAAALVCVRRAAPRSSSR